MVWMDDAVVILKVVNRWIDGWMNGGWPVYSTAAKKIPKRNEIYKLHVVFLFVVSVVVRIRLNFFVYTIFL